MKKVAVFVLLTGVALGYLHGGEPRKPELDRATREALIAAGNLAIRKHIQTDPAKREGNEISKEHWGEAIARLKPLRVRNDGLHAFIVLTETKTNETGLYVSNPISSSAPGMGKRFVVSERLTEAGDKAFGELYRYEIQKPPTKLPEKGKQ